MGSLYCQPADLALCGVNQFALIDVPLSTQQGACVQASDQADSWGFRGRYGNNSPILLAWGSDVTFNVARIAVWICLKSRGVNPDAGADVYWQYEYEESRDWLKGVGHGSVNPNVTPSANMNTNQGPDLPQVRTEPQRGYQEYSGGRPSVS